MSDFGILIPGDTYLATVNTIFNGTLTDSLGVPTITIYDPSRNVVVSSVSMTRTGTGTYGYSYVTNGSAPSGVWESIISANVETGKTLPGNDYWNVAAAPPQVIINSITNSVTPNITANTTITNEGTFGYEYHYEWCVVTNIANTCGGGDDVFYGSAAKFINPGEDFNTTLLANVPNAGNYFFKLRAFFGTESSSASRSFAATTGGNQPGGGGGGGGGGPSTPPAPTLPTGQCVGADLNGDGVVNSVDFSIMLFFWKTSPPFTNTCVDINRDSAVSSIDFSILLAQWGGRGRALTQ
jgi:hypothetical protein